MIFDIDAVKTGKYRKGDEMQTSKAVKLYATFADFIQQELFNNAILSDWDQDSVYSWSKVVWVALPCMGRKARQTHMGNFHQAYSLVYVLARSLWLAFSPSLAWLLDLAHSILWVQEQSLVSGSSNLCKLQFGKQESGGVEKSLKVRRTKLRSWTRLWIIMVQYNASIGKALFLSFLLKEWLVFQFL